MKKMMVFCVLLFVAVPVMAQWEASDYLKYDYTNFEQNPLFHERIDFNDIDIRLAHAAIFFMTNKIRVEHGLQPLAYLEELECAAWNHAKHMVEGNFFSHTDNHNSGWREVGDRYRQCGIVNPNGAENIATEFGLEYQAGTPLYVLDKHNGVFSYTPNGEPLPARTYLSLAEVLLESWMNSPGHRKNILSENGLQLGCGIYFFPDPSFNNIMSVKAVQNFQRFELAQTE